MLAGGVQGFGEGVASVGRQWTAQQHSAALADAQNLRERSLAELRGQIAGGAQQRGFEHSDRTQTRQQTFQAEQNAAQRTSAEGIHAADRTAREYKPQELLDLYKAQADRLNAESSAIRQGFKYGPKDGRPALPQIKVERDSDGKIYNVDTTSGAVGLLVPGQPAVPGETRWFGPNDPDTPATQPQIQWSLNGKPLQNGLSDLYPAIRERTTGSTAAPPSGRTGWDSTSSDPLNLRPSLNPPAGRPAEADIKKLQSLHGNPAAIAAFDTKFGAGSAARYLGNKTPTTTPERAPIESFFSGAPAKGTVVDGFKFNGGDPRQQSSWERAQGGGAPQSGSATPSSGSITRIMPQLVTAPAGRSSPKERHEASMSKLQAENSAHYAQRIADTFKSIIETGRYTPDDRPFLELALERGALTASEKQIATKMLGAIGEAEFASGYKGAR